MTLVIGFDCPGRPRRNSTLFQILLFEYYALFALAPILLAYIFEALLIGPILGYNHPEPLRTHAVRVLVCAGVLETYDRLTESVVLPQRGSYETVYMWHNNLTFYRHILFLLLNQGQKVVVDGVEIPEEGGLKTSTRQVVGTLKMACVPSQYW
ncbi:hypothetical protein BDN72DRAFT_535557 [Pluteus cervinus]|uniref:Uncharacterized protein n=1 Tax=Pluteus cervinus TaxID=181527 RepID=A0ACD3A4R8_9AGAR|nr:hypothetical protein BDN72DRAFT_535557 [Pluteus cervinus]